MTGGRPGRIVGRMKLHAFAAIAALAATVRPAVAGAPRPIADQLDAAAARDALAKVSAIKAGMPDMEDDVSTLEVAIGELGRGGDVEDLRALVAAADASKPQLTVALLDLHAYLGDRADVDQIIAAVD